MLPEGWERLPIKDACSDIIDCVNKTAPVVDFVTPYRMIRTTNVRNGRVDTQDVRYVTQDTYTQWTKRGTPQTGDLIFTREAPVGEAGILKDAQGVFLGQRTMMYRANPKKSSNLFLFYSLESPFCKKQIDDLSNGGTVAHMRVPDCGEIIINLPPLPEQKKIAAILSTWDRAIEGTEKLLANSQQQKKALMQQLLTGKKRLPGFTGEWEKVSLEKTGKIVSGGTPDTTVPAYWDGDVLWLTPTDVTSLRGKYVDDTKRKITQTGIKDSSTILLPVGSLLVCTRATIGYMAIAKKPITTNQGFKNIVFNKLFLPEFVYYFLCTQKHEIQRLASGSTFAEISKKDFGKIHISAPLLPEQQAIATVLTTADEEITALESDLSRLRQEKKALMQQLLTGKRRVTVD
ncbi:restriction endonuclease subunit S [Gluconobacter sp. R75690]|uniref:restriction endonuclease subunit S n=1 Tax=unclassified Gluconobacter TaxID=2644261 RepID=UPI00188AA874|nr:MULTISPECIES: restriction endonuclease subunit S [unclassified Gluconobacter]MBF0852308.1 restriction endonuclease subunit S [Gluconobacter sp. R75690]MBF0880999.1 restriction endonuclease subunit S [Gluconobacter sp. R75828]